MGSDQFRYDSIWRRIRTDNYALKLEGQFRDSRDRLGSLNNWGSLAWLYPHATATKEAHHRGIEHNALTFLGSDETREKYRPSFRIASHVLFWGHLPLSYAGAEGVLRASHVHPQGLKVLEGIFNDVIAFGELQCTHEDHFENCAAEVLVGERPFELYKWLSAWLLSRRWKRVWKAVKNLTPTEQTEQEIKCAAVRALVCRQDFGYQLLDLCRLADYIPRDLQQAGTAWLTVDIEALWETSPLRSDRAQEWSLLQAASNYLEDRFFLSPDAQLVHSLASRAIAQGLVSKGVTRDNLLTLLSTTSGDDQYRAFFTEYHRRRLQDVQRMTKGETLSRFWSHIGTFERVRVPARSRLDVEDFFSGRVGRGRLSYPMTANFSVLVQSDDEGLSELSGVDSRDVTLTLHHRHDGRPSPARPAIDIALAVRVRQSKFRRRQVSAGIAGWLVRERVELRDRPVYKAAGDALGSREEEIRPLINAIGGSGVFSPGKDPMGDGVMLRRLARRPALPSLTLGRSILELPLGAVRSKKGKALLEILREQSTQLAGTGSGAERGAYLEAAVCADQLLSTDLARQRLLLIGSTALSNEGRPTGEWDVLRLDLAPNGDWLLVAIECSVSTGEKKESADRDKLERLRLALHKRFSDLYEYRTRLASLSGGVLTYEDGARGFVRT